MAGNPDPYSRFKQVLDNELDFLRPEAPGDSPDSARVTETRNPYERAHRSDLTGLAFSGGGIRSATFNLGVIQALAKTKISGPDKEKTENPEVTAGILAHFDYLSTVSGGGYIGSWLSAWLNREKSTDDKTLSILQDRVTTRPCRFNEMPGDEDECARKSGLPSPENSGFPPLEHAAIRHLRRYSNYLSPRLGISGDLFAVISLFLRNLVILQTELILLVASVLLVPYLVTSISVFVIGAEPAIGPTTLSFFASGFALLLFTLVIWRRQFRDVIAPTGNSEEKRIWKAKQRQRQKASGFWMTLSVVLLPLAFWLLMVSLVPTLVQFVDRTNGPPLFFIAIYGGIYFLAWLASPGFAANVNASEFDGSLPRKLIKRAFIALIASVLFGVLIHFCTLLFDVTTFNTPQRKAFMAVTGVPVILLITSFSIAFQLGVARNLYSERERERWARAGGLVLLAAGVWLAVFAVAVYTPPLVNWLGNGGIAALATWAGASTAGAWLARNSTNISDKLGFSFRTILVRLAPWFFLIGLALVVSYVLSLLVNAISLGDSPRALRFPSGIPVSTGITVYSMLIEHVKISVAALLLLVGCAAFLLFSWRLDLNMFSAHTIYRNRLVRAYLGASNLEKRNPHPFTGFDPRDDFELTEMNDQKPVHIINATVNMSGGDDLAWQTRRAASFTFTPNFCGFEAKSSKGIDLGGYRATQDFSRSEDNLVFFATPGKTKNSRAVTLGTAMAISGAAASPNMGYNTSTPISALLTVFNMRLGYWAGNPTPVDPSADTRVSAAVSRWLIPSWQRKRPLLSVSPLIAELTGSANAESSWINLSDGGHFDNLGIYELIRRRCRLIVVTDAGCDRNHQFQDLANTVRKCWTDFGVNIFFPDLKELCLEDADRPVCTSHGSVGLIEYPDRNRPEKTGELSDQERYGLIVYLKSSLTDEVLDKYVDIRQYSVKNPSFPHEPTSDQFFDENQFEAYRHLGFIIADSFRPLIASLFDGDSGRLRKDRLRGLAREILEK